jgi:hypothetical protein
MKKLFTFTFILSLISGAFGQMLQPIERQVGKLNISIDPRMELLSVIQILSEYQNIVRTSEYSKDILSYFGSFAGSKAVRKTNELLENQKFSFDAPVALMLHFSQVPELKQKTPYSDYLLKRGGGKENLDFYISDIQNFALETNFIRYWKSKQEFYKKIIDLTISELGNQDLVKTLEDYFLETQNSYNIIISPSFNGGYGPSLPGINGKLDIYSCISTTSNKDGIPFLSKDVLSYYVLHEFGHSFVNPESSKYPERIQANSKLFGPIMSDMSKMAYGSWNICVNEHILRATHIRMKYQINDQVNISNLINQEKANRFIYIEPLVKKLLTYENQRDLKKITFAEFYPKLIDVLDSLANSDYEKLAEVKFLGPINSVARNQRLAWIYPTFDKDTSSLRIAYNYVKRIYDRLKSEGNILIPDSVAIKTNLSNYGLMVYGTIESNLFLIKYKTLFPFKMENQLLIADKEYRNASLKFISCIPNPMNPQKGMAIYTAFTNRNIVDINSVFHGPEDYIIFITRDSVLTKGFYSKTNNWKFNN